MTVNPNIAEVAKLVTDPSRAAILTALLDDRFYTATELAGYAGIKQQTASFHLSKLLDAEMLTCRKQGRHRYYRLKDGKVAQSLETLLNIAPLLKFALSGSQPKIGRSEKRGHAMITWLDRSASHLRSGSWRWAC
ncbi:hypothetical protein RSC3_03864 [Bacillus paralicheniformis]|nr:hypothetical protein RSC3_03864 [Bacillus paralicheniformis]